MSLWGLQALINSPLAVVSVVGCHRGPDGRLPVTRTRAQWAELVALWYAVHGSTLLERLRLIVVVWWLARRRRLQEPCTIRLNPEAFGVKVKVYPPQGVTGMSRARISWPKPPGDSGGVVLR